MSLRARIETALGPAYRVERELGGGGMSHVFVAEEVALGRRVVVKVLPPEMAATVNAERFQREILTLASLQHPNVVPLIAAGGQGDLLWFTMPLVEGEELRARLSREGALPIADALRIWGDMLDALAYAHAKGVIHRDIKPENVLVSGRHALVADFGVSKALADAAGARSATMTGLSIGTPAYMSPERAMADSATDHRSDI
jgi:eukaryotic-like serine/threonine-protein kinase